MRKYFFLIFCQVITGIIFDCASIVITPEQCGVSLFSTQANPRIVNGSISTAGRWPWQVMIMEQGIQVCGGSLVNHEWIVTAAHCMTRLSTIAIGASRKDASDSSVQNRKPSLINCHKDFDPGDFSDDICMIKMSEPVEYNDFIFPICLPDNGTHMRVGDICTVTGWGDKNSEGTASAYLREAEVRILNREDCARWYSEDSVSLPERHFCAGYQEGGIDTCFGDSGGPLTRLETSHSTDKKYVLRGITSFGIKCALRQRPGVYTSVVEYLNWMDRTMDRIYVDSSPGICSHTGSAACGSTVRENTVLRTSVETGCTWTIEAPNGYEITFTFLCYFLLSKNDGQCVNYIKIRDEYSGNERIFCGSELPEPYEVASDKADISFISTRRDTVHDFMIMVNFTKTSSSSSATQPSLKFITVLICCLLCVKI